jgi:hypothetical protein
MWAMVNAGEILSGTTSRRTKYRRRVARLVVGRVCLAARVAQKIAGVFLSDVYSLLRTTRDCPPL